MFMNPRDAIRNGWVTGLVDEEKQIQPNAIDFTLDHVFDISTGIFVISEQGKQMRGGNKIEPARDRASGIDFWFLQGGQSYDGMSDVYVDLPKGIAVLPVITRSTFNRNGIFITSGLYDSGFKGHIGFVIHNMVASAKIGAGTRIGQIAFIESEAAKMYDGGWNHEKGTHYTQTGAVLQPGPGPVLEKQ